MLQLNAHSKLVQLQQKHPQVKNEDISVKYMIMKVFNTKEQKNKFGGRIQGPPSTRPTTQKRAHIIYA